MPIQILDKSVIDQISAGEVVERPSHLIKELIENSLDAGATKIDIRYEDGGRNIQIQDNGSGLSPEDLILSIERHATSKINSYKDLWSLNTFGYRGEALAAISAVSEFEMISKTKEGIPYSLKVNFGEKKGLLKTQSSQGTLVKVSRLFENTPARLKFLKTPNYEHSLIRQVVKAYILSRADVEWKVFENKKLVINAPAQSSLGERAKLIFGDAEVFQHKETTEDGYEIEFVYQSPYEVESNTKNIWIFVQDRWIQDRTIHSALMSAFKNLLMNGEFPKIAVKLTIPSDFVDVNIHPTKSQVKFVDSQKIYKLVYNTIANQVSRGDWNKNKETARIASYEREEGLSSPPESVFLAQQKAFFGPELLKTQFKNKVSWAEGNSSKYNSASEESLFGISNEDNPNIEVSKPRSFDSKDEESESAVWSRLQVVGQVDLTYIVCQDAEKMILIDQHAAHERVLFERLLKYYVDGGMPVQKYLIPLSLDLEVYQFEFLSEIESEFKKLGVEWEQSGPSSLLILSAPAQVSENAVIKLIRNTLSDVETASGSKNFQNKIRDQVATLACHSAVRAGQSLSHEEMVSLLKSMDEFPLSNFCPHGRPVNVEFSFNFLEKQFGRIN